MTTEQTIPGLDIALASMKEGEVAIIYCKASYGYGEFGNPMVIFLCNSFQNSEGFHSMGSPIPADSTLKFELEFLSFDPPYLVYKNLGNVYNLNYRQIS